MRSLSRLLVPVSMLATLLATSAPARADDAHESVVFRGGKPWLHVGGRYFGAAPASDVASRANAIVKLHTNRAELRVASTEHFGDGDTVVRFEQAYRGLPVVGRGASVRLSPQGQPIMTMIDVEDQLPSDLTPTLSSLNAASVASTRMRIGAKPNEAHLMIWPTLDHGARLAYAVVPRIPAGIPMAPRVIVDAQTGEVLEARDLITYAAPQAFTYEFNPIKTPTEANRPLALLPTGVNLTNEFITSTNCLDNKTVKPVNFGGFDLNVHVCDLVQVAAADANGDFIFQPSDVSGSPEARKDTYSEVSIYYHTGKAYEFFRGLQGDETAQVVVDKPLRLIANLQIPAGLTTGNITAAADPNTPLDTFQNAFFSPAGQGLGQIFDELYGFNAGALWFGQGPKRDYSYDGDVIYHEFTHAVVDKTLQLGQWHVDSRGVVDSPGAMNEGLADFFSSAITGDPDVGEYAAEDVGSGANIRTLANKDKCPTSIQGEVHQDSTVFSGGLWDARSSFTDPSDRTKFDKALYKAMRLNIGKGDLGYEDLTALFSTTLKTDFPEGATKLEAAMTARGLLPMCERIFPFTTAPITSADARIGFTAPGTQSVAVKSLAPGLIQVQGKLPAGTTAVTVTFKASAAQAGGGNPLGGQATPFAPVVLAKFGKAITWDAKNGHDADLKVDAKTSTATIPVPDGNTADSIFVQIANSGQSDGAYDSVALAYVGGGAVSTEPTPDPTPDPVPAAPAPAAAPASDSGCGCEAVGDGRRTFAFFPGILAIGALLLRRRASKARKL